MLRALEAAEAPLALLCRALQGHPELARELRPPERAAVHGGPVALRRDRQGADRQPSASVSPDRLIFANGADIGQTPVLGLIDEGIVQSSHDYQPKMISHYKAAWVPAGRVRVPGEAHVADGRQARRALEPREAAGQEEITKWKPLTDRGAPGPRRGMGLLHIRRPTTCASPGWPTSCPSGRRPAGDGPCGTCAAASGSSTAAAPDVGLRGLHGPQARPQDAGAAPGRLGAAPYGAAFGAGEFPHPIDQLKAAAAAVVGALPQAHLRQRQRVCPRASRRSNQSPWTRSTNFAWM